MNIELFNWKEYINNNNDLKHIKNKKDAWEHWIHYGKYEKRIFYNLKNIKNTTVDFSEFNWKEYIHLHQDLSCIKNKEEAWKHWINHGQNEGRQLKLENIYSDPNIINKTNIKDYFNFENGNGEDKNILLFKKKYDLYGLHYFGWKNVINNYIKYFNDLFLNNHSKCYNYIIKNNILFDEWIEKLLLWGDNLEKKVFLNYIQQNNYQLITFIHNPPFLKYFDKKYKKKISNNVIINDEYQLNQNLINKIEDYKLIDKIIFLYVLSNDHKKHIYENYPLLRKKIVSILHPINSLSTHDIPFNIDLFMERKNMYHIGWWLRNFKSFINFKQPIGFHKNILIKNDFINEWKNISKHHDISNINLIYELSNEEYVKIFSNSCIFIDLEDAVGNNVILECLKYNTPFITKRIPSIEEYVGSKYPLFFDDINDIQYLSLSDETTFINLIKKANNYLIQLDKKHISLNMFNAKLTFDINKLIFKKYEYDLTWYCLLNNSLNDITNYINNIINQENFNKIYFILALNDNIDTLEIKDFLNIIIEKYDNIKCVFFENENLNYFIENSNSKYCTISNIFDIHLPSYSNKLINYLENNHTCDVCFSNYDYIESENNVNNNLLTFKKDTLIFKYMKKYLPRSSMIWRKNIHDVLGNFSNNNYTHFFINCIKYNFNIMCASNKVLYKTQKG